jgi:hypothetical protein
MGRPKLTLMQRIESIIKRIRHSETGCWLWVGDRERHGYGVIRTGKIPHTREMAHRMVWKIFRGPIPEGLDVLHRCDVPPCVNPAHLFVGTHADNMRDMVAKGRNKGPRRHPERHLTADKVREIRARYTEIANLTTLAKEFGICTAQAHNIVRRKCWKHVV